MKRLSSIIYHFSFSVALLLLLASCSKNKGAQLIPDDAIVVVRIDPVKMLKGGGDGEDSELKKRLKKEINNMSADKEIRQKLTDIVDDPTSSGFDFTEPVYFYLAGDLNRNADFGFVGSVASKSDLTDLLETVFAEEENVIMDEGDGGVRYAAMGPNVLIYNGDWFYVGTVNFDRDYNPDIDSKIETLLARIDGEETIMGNEGFEKMEVKDGLAQLLVVGSNLGDEAEAMTNILPDELDLRDMAMLFDFTLDESEAVLTGDVLAFSDAWQEYIDKNDKLANDFTEQQLKYVSGHAFSALVSVDAEKYIKEVTRMLQKVAPEAFDQNGPLAVLKEYAGSLEGTLSLDIRGISEEGRPQIAVYAATTNDDIINHLLRADSDTLALADDGSYLLPITEYDWFSDQMTVVDYAAAGFKNGLTFYVSSNGNQFQQTQNELDYSDLKGKGFYMRFNFACLNDYVDMIDGKERDMVQSIADGLGYLEAYYEGDGTTVLRLAAKDDMTIGEAFGQVLKSLF
jgi:hypothetical protein